MGNEQSKKDAAAVGNWAAGARNSVAQFASDMTGLNFVDSAKQDNEAYGKLFSGDVGGFFNGIGKEGRDIFTGATPLTMAERERRQQADVDAYEKNKANEDDWWAQKKANEDQFWQDKKGGEDKYWADQNAKEDHYWNYERPRHFELADPNYKGPRRFGFDEGVKTYKRPDIPVTDLAARPMIQDSGVYNNASIAGNSSSSNGVVNTQGGM